MSLTPADVAQMQAMIDSSASPWTVGQGFQDTLATVFQAGNTVITATGVFVYNGAPAHGNLIASIAGSAGTDAFGNAYPAGLNLSQGTISGSLITGSIGGSTILNSTFSGGAVTESVITFDTGGGMLLVYITTVVTQTFTAAGPISFGPVAAGVTTLDVAVVGGGYGGQGGQAGVISGAGGGGGEFAREPALAVTPGNTYNGVVGAGSAGSAVGGNGAPAGTSSTFTGDSVTVTGNTPAPNQSGGASGSTNTIHFNGGNGGSVNVAPGSGAGGGGSGGSASPGNNGAGTSGGLGGGVGGAAVAGGGAGGHGSSSTGTAGTAGAQPGGGGGGGGATATTQFPGTAAGNGNIIVKYVSGRTLIASIAPVAGTDAAGNSFPAGIMGNIVAVQPGSVPQVPETWHNFPLATNFAVPAGGEVPAYRLTSDGLVEMKGEVVFTSAGAGLVNGTAFTTAIPSGYWPAIRKLMTANIHGGTGNPVLIANNTPFVQMSTAGILTLNGVTSTAVATDTAFFTFWGRYSLTNP